MKFTESSYLLAAINIFLLPQLPNFLTLVRLL